MWFTTQIDRPMDRKESEEIDPSKYEEIGPSTLEYDKSGYLKLTGKDGTF